MASKYFWTASAHGRVLVGKKWGGKTRQATPQHQTLGQQQRQQPRLNKAYLPQPHTLFKCRTTNKHKIMKLSPAPAPLSPPFSNSCLRKRRFSQPSKLDYPNLNLAGRYKKSRKSNQSGSNICTFSVVQRLFHVLSHFFTKCIQKACCTSYRNFSSKF